MTEAFLQFGGLGLAAYVVVWLTQRLNGKVDRLTAAVERLADAIEHSPLPHQATSPHPSKRR